MFELPPPPRISRLILLGHPVAHSLSPRFQNAALAAAGRAQRYSAVDVPPGTLDDVLHRLVRERAAGNVTVPHKEAVAGRCDRLSPLGARVGAVNCWWVDAQGALVGDNTDVGGFDAAARALVPSVEGLTVAVVGAGGSARAVLAAVGGWPGARVRIWARSPARAAELAGAGLASDVTVAPSVGACVANAALVVNATPLGLRDDDPFPVDLAALPRAAAVLDLVYRAGETPWVRAARAAGHAGCDGLPMLLEQGALAYERWFGVAPDRRVMWNALQAAPPS